MPEINTNQIISEKLLRVCEAFRIPGLFFSYEEVQMGNVNHTYKVNYIYDDGKGMAKIKSYLVQKLNSVAFSNPSNLMKNIERVTEYIRKNNPEALTLHFHHTKDGMNFMEDNGSFWRVSNYIPSVTFNNGNDINVVKNTGIAFGNFQMMLVSFDVNELTYTIPDFHNTRKRYEALKKSVKEDKCSRVKEVSDELNWLLSVEDKACILTDMCEKGEIPLRVTHNDTKINNVLFDEATHEPLAVIDLDTVMPGLVAHDFGDAIRFASNFVEEDSKEIEKIGLDLNIFWAFAEGFLSKTARILTENEIATLGLSPFTLACELSARFLTDYLDGDVYFKKDYDNHNLVRTRAQIALAKDMLTKTDAMDAICRKCAIKYKV